MVIFTILVAFLAIGIVLLSIPSDYDVVNLIGSIIAIIAGLLLVVTLICWPINYYGTQDAIQRYDAISETIENARDAKFSDIERAALTKQISEVNQELASARYWNDSIFDIFIADEYAELKPLK